MKFNYESKMKLIKYNWTPFVNTAMRVFSVEWLKHRITVLWTEKVERITK